MFHPIFLRISLIVFASFYLHACTQTQKVAADIDESLPSKLERTEVERIEHGFIDGTVSKPSGNSIYIEQAEISFSPSWESKYRSRVTPSFKQRTSKLYAKLLREEFIEAFEKSGYVVVEEASAADFLMIPKVKELNIYAPDSHLGKSFSYETGNALLIANFVVDKNFFLVFAEHRETNNYIGQLKRVTQASNASDFKRYFRRWAKDVVEAYGKFNH